MSGPVLDVAETVLDHRLCTVGDVLGVDRPGRAGTQFDVLVDLVDAVRDADSPASAWLLIVGLTAAFPEPSLVQSVGRAIATKGSEEAVVWLLDAVAPLAMQYGNAESRLRVVVNRPLVDVNFTAKSNFLTGIQRVVRGVVSEWEDRHDIEFVVWTGRGGAYRGLNDDERARLLEREVGAYEAATRQSAERGADIVVPWGVPVTLTEVPPVGISDRLAAIAQHTDASLRVIGYDCIPMSSAETVPLAEPEKFGRYLELVKFSDRLAGISRAASVEFEGFNRALAAQGLRGPTVTACPLPHTTPVVADPGSEPAPPRPLVVSVGTVGRRKNQTALVEAAEMLWREGLDFELRIFGHVGSEHSPLTVLVPELQSQGRHLVIESGVSDARIAGALDHASCLVFPSLHEGFGLPVTEALSHGVPVITSDFGSMREVAEGQGGILVDPEDVQSLADSLRALLTDSSLHAQLVAEARARPVRTWTEYAVDLWEVLLA